MIAQNILSLLWLLSRETNFCQAFSSRSLLTSPVREVLSQTTRLSSSWYGGDDFDDGYYRDGPSSSSRRGGRGTPYSDGRSSTRRSAGGGRGGSGRGGRGAGSGRGRGRGTRGRGRERGSGRGYNNNNDFESRGSQSQQPRSSFDRDDFYDDYDDFIQQDNRHVQIHQKSSSQSSSSDSINCPHFGTCPGCVVDTNVDQVDIIQSAKLYFSSTSIQKHVSFFSRRGGPSMHHRDNRRYYDYDDFSPEEFYKVVIPSSLHQWRTQAKLAVAPTSTWNRSAGCSIGLYARNTHNVLNIPECQVHHPSINKAVEMVRSATAKVRTPPYNEDTGEGLLRYIQLQVELSTGRVCLTLVMNAEKLKECQPHLSYLTSELKKMDKNSGEERLFHSIWCHCNDSSGNAIFARDVTRWHPVEGPPFIRERIPGSEETVDENGEEKREGLLYFSPMVFRQGNLEGFSEIAKEVREAIPAGSKVCELYAGVGLLGLSALLYHGKMDQKFNTGGDSKGGSVGLGWLRCSDENPENLRCFERAVSSMPMHITGRTPKNFQKGDGKKKGKSSNRRKAKQSDAELSIKDLMDTMMSETPSDILPSTEDDPSEKVTYMVANAATALFKGDALGADVIVVDPPRKGLEDPVLQQLCQPRNSNQPYVEKADMLSHLPRHTINWTNNAKTLIYVSCGFDAIARDCDRLLSSSAGWKLESATGYVLFPGSNHVESVVVFRR
mmetsp:Transcript_4105/g.8013  ORF Transcript_4105/g.8013 Transcript_4105/m.8013 type:complete len:721 (-) Transcript_4105:87-2249(-)